MKLYQAMSLAILVMISTTMAVIIGAFINITYGPWIALILVILMSFTLMVTIESLALSVLDAQPIRESTPMAEKVKNIAIKVGVENVAFYSSDRFRHNLYCFMGPRNCAHIVIGQNLSSFLSASEVEALIYCALARSKSGESQFQTYALALAALFYLPFLLAPKPSKNRGAQIIRSLLLYYHAPFDMLRLWLMRNDRHLLEIDVKTAKRFSIEEEMASAFFKMGHMPSPTNKNLSEKVIDSFAVADTLSMEIFPHVLHFGIKMEDRYNALRELKE